MNLLILYLLVYGISAISTIFTFFTVLLTAILLIASVATSLEDQNPLKNAYSKPLIICALICLTISTLLPNQKTVYILAGSYIVLNSEKVQEIGDKTLTLIDTKLQTIIEQELKQFDKDTITTSNIEEVK